MTKQATIVVIGSLRVKEYIVDSTCQLCLCAACVLQRGSLLLVNVYSSILSE